MKKIENPFDYVTKKDFEYLEKLFCFELPDYQDTYPHQLHPKVAKRLIDLGYVQEVEWKDRHGGMVFLFKGHVLTLFGHMTFCYNCERFISEDEALT